MHADFEIVKNLDKNQNFRRNSSKLRSYFELRDWTLSIGHLLEWAFSTGAIIRTKIVDFHFPGLLMVLFMWILLTVEGLFELGTSFFFGNRYWKGFCRLSLTGRCQGCRVVEKNLTQFQITIVISSTIVPNFFEIGLMLLILFLFQIYTENAFKRSPGET